MASYHLTAKIGKKGKAAAHAAYISREGKYSGRDRYEDLEATASGNMPKWAAHNAAHFWQAADEHERVNGSVYREIEVALPRELTPTQRLELVQEFIEQELSNKHAYQFAIHTPKAALEKDDQPHAHIMYSERIRDGIARDPDHYFKRYNAKNPEKGGAKKFSGGKSANELKAELLGLRERWATLQNAHLEKHGHNDRVDHRSLKDQGIDREPEKHFGAIGVSRLNAHDISALLERRTAEGELERARREVSIIDLSGGLEKAKAEKLDESLKSYQPLFDAVAKKAAEDGFTERERAVILEQVKERLIQNNEAGELKREAQVLERSLIELSGSLSAAKADRDRQQTLARQQAQANLKTPENPVKPVLRQGEEQAPQNPEKLAEQIKGGFVEEARKAWREEAAAREFEKAQGYQQQAKLLRGAEPKKPFLVGVKDWQIAHRVWSGKVANAEHGARYAEKQARDTLAGTLDNDSGQAWAWNKQAQERLEKEHPLLAQAVKEKHLAEQHRAKEEEGLDKALSAFKAHALKREMKAFGYGETGKQWNAIPEKLRTMIEGFNQLPKEGRAVVLDRLRENWKREPEAAAKITQQLEQAEEQNRGMIR
jgi:MobA/MobL family